MALHNRQNFFCDETNDLAKKFRLAEFVAIEPLHQFLPGVDDNFIGHGHMPQAVHRARVEFKGALVVELLQDVLLDLVQRAVRVDEVIMEGLLE